MKGRSPPATEPSFVDQLARGHQALEILICTWRTRLQRLPTIERKALVVPRVHSILPSTPKLSWNTARDTQARCRIASAQAPS